MRLYRLLQWSCIFVAVIVTVVVWKRVPIVGDPLDTVIPMYQFEKVLVLKYDITYVDPTAINLLYFDRLNLIVVPAPVEVAPVRVIVVPLMLKTAENIVDEPFCPPTART